MNNYQYIVGEANCGVDYLPAILPLCYGTNILIKKTAEGAESAEERGLVVLKIDILFTKAKQRKITIDN